MRMSDWSSDVCSSDLAAVDLGDLVLDGNAVRQQGLDQRRVVLDDVAERFGPEPRQPVRVGAVDAHLVSPSHARTLGPGTDTLGRPSCRERRCQYVLISLGAVLLNK